jgi:hypothetical protein
MAEQQILSGKALWCFDYELQQANLADEFRGMMSFTLPLHYHKGDISLSNTAIYINGDVDLHIPLNSLEQLYMGFDELYKSTYVKNGGLLWQPLKLSFTGHPQAQAVYLIIDHNWFTVKNKLWFDTLTTIFEA